MQPHSACSWPSDASATCSYRTKPLQLFRAAQGVTAVVAVLRSRAQRLGPPDDAVRRAVGNRPPRQRAADDSRSRRGPGDGPVDDRAEPQTARARGLGGLQIDAQDRRRRNVTITDKGLSHYALAQPLWRAAQERFEESFGSEAARDLRAALRSIVDAPAFAGDGEEASPV